MKYLPAPDHEMAPDIYIDFASFGFNPDLIPEIAEFKPYVDKDILYRIEFVRKALGTGGKIVPEHVESISYSYFGEMKRITRSSGLLVGWFKESRRKISLDEDPTPYESFYRDVIRASFGKILVIHKNGKKFMYTSS